MKNYNCQRCGAGFAYVSEAAGRFCADCGAPLAFTSEEPSPWGMFEAKADL